MKNKSMNNYSLGNILSPLLSLCHNNNFLLLPGSFLSGLLVYYILWHLLSVPLGTVVPLAVILSVLIFALTRYYCSGFQTKYFGNNISLPRSRLTKNKNSDYLGGLKEDNIDNTYPHDKKLNATFVIVYVIFLTIVGLGSFGYHSFNGSDGGVFIPWEQFLNSFSNILYLVAAICLCFFMPGYALVKMLLGKNNNEITKSSLPLLKRSLPRYLISYFFSMLITGLTVYIIASEVEFAPAQVGENGVAYCLILFKI